MKIWIPPVQPQTFFFFFWRGAGQSLHSRLAPSHGEGYGQLWAHNQQGKLVLPASVWKILGEGLDDLYWLITHTLDQCLWSGKHEILYLAQLWSHARPCGHSG